MLNCHTLKPVTLHTQQSIVSPRITPRSSAWSTALLSSVPTWECWIPDPSSRDDQLLRRRPPQRTNAPH